jgi:hypothetical protein
MKKYYLIFILINVICKGQTHSEQLIGNTWYLTEMKIGNTTHYPPTNEELDYISMNILPEEGSQIYTFQSKICSTIGGMLNWVTDEAFSFFDYSCCGSNMCTTQVNYDFELLYSELYLEGYEGATFNYSISSIENHLQLVIQSPLGNTAIYQNVQLSSIEQVNHLISIYPNPVIDKLIIDNPELKILSINITDVSGKIVFSSREFNSNKIEIDFSSIANGVYFLTTDINGKIVKTEKVLKK